MLKTYYEKLKDPRWQRKRLEVMQRDDYEVNEMAYFFFQLFDPNSIIHQNAKLHFRSFKNKTNNG